MENIEDYDDNVQGIIKQIERLFKKAKTASEADKMGVLTSVKKAIRELKDELVYFKQELFNIPKQRE